ncbi:MAG: right-handed parallel beta-helix repeat-containing protein [Lachnospiraceae bacterium]
MNKPCPHCSRPIPEEASFCPHCAKSINQRTTSGTPKYLSKKACYMAALVLLLAVLGTVLYISTRPRNYDGMGEVVYTDSSGTYLLVTNTGTNLYQGNTYMEQTAGEQENYRFPLRFHITRKDSGEDVGALFLEKVKSVAIHVGQPDDSPYPVQCTEPEPGSITYPDAALVTYVDFNRHSTGPMQIIWELFMKNGDNIRVRMNFDVTPTYTHNFDSETDDLSDSASLQALIDRLAEKSPVHDTVNIYLPAVTYTEPIILHDRAYNLIGSEADGQRTTFTAGVQLRANQYNISYLTDLDFIGSGSGIGISTAGRMWAKGCRFTDWDSAILCYGETWANATGCTFENNETGFHFNAEGPNVNDTRFTENTFTNNTTAVLLEKAPGNHELDFSQTVFSGNGTDIDNRCDQPMDTSQAVFR